ncbi:MAG: nucleotidyltransferase domain-containing protein [Natronospirillum sp.]
MGIYCFGSQAQTTAGPDSDLDLAVLVAGYVDTVSLWNVGNKLANELNIDLDLLDLRAASTVMQYQIITGGQRLWSAGIEADEFELYVLSEKFDLDLWRQPQIDQIREEGRVYDR